MAYFCTVILLVFVPVNPNGPSILCNTCNIIKNEINKCVSQEFANQNYDPYSIELCCKKQFDKIKELCNVAHPNINDYTQYDITINKKWSFLRELKNGWEVEVSKNIKNRCEKYAPKLDDNVTPSDTSELKECLANQMKVRSCFVGFIGGFNKGKTYVLNLIFDTNFASGYNEHGETKGINIFIPENSRNIIFDTPGVSRSVSQSDLQDRFMTDRFVEDLVLSLGDIVVLIVNVLTTEEQVLINKLIKNVYQYSTWKCTKQIVIVHNFKELLTPESVDYHIQTDIVHAFEAEKIPPQSSDATIYEHSFDELTVEHYILARDGSEAGNKYNKETIKELKTRLSVGCPCKRFLNLMDHLTNALEPQLRNYFPTPETIDDNSNTADGNSNTDDDKSNLHYLWEILKQPFKIIIDELKPPVKINKPYDELTKLLNDLDKDPFKLHWDIVFNSDNTDYNIILKLKNEHDLEYCSVKDIGDKPQCGPDPSCKVFKSSETFIIECVLPDVTFGDRNNMDKSLWITMDDNNDELHIHGTMVGSYKRLLNIDENLKIMVEDSKSDGWVTKIYKVGIPVHNNWKERKQIYKNGVLTIAVPVKPEHKRNTDLWKKIVKELDDVSKTNT